MKEVENKFAEKNTDSGKQYPTNLRIVPPSSPRPSAAPRRRATVPLSDSKLSPTGTSSNSNAENSVVSQNNSSEPAVSTNMGQEN